MKTKIKELGRGGLGARTGRNIQVQRRTVKLEYVSGQEGGSLSGVKGSKTRRGGWERCCRGRI